MIVIIPIRVLPALLLIGAFCGGGMFVGTTATRIVLAPSALVAKDLWSVGILLLVAWVLFNVYRNAFTNGDEDPVPSTLYSMLGLSTCLVFIFGLLGFGVGIAAGVIVEKEVRFANGGVVSPSGRAGGGAAGGDPKIAARSVGPPRRAPKVTVTRGRDSLRQNWCYRDRLGFVGGSSFLGVG